MLTDQLRQALREAQDQVNALVLGKVPEVRLAFVALLSGGHLLIEDLPGLGKTTLAHALASSLGLSFQRVQFTSDLLPADVLGVSVYEAGSRQFQFHPGPVFTHVLLADEINRAPPRTQSALLEAMAEQQVTLDGQTHPLPDPFFVIATQNPGGPVRHLPAAGFTAGSLPAAAGDGLSQRPGRARAAAWQRPPRPDRAGRAEAG
ncbi:hypothetical protein BN1263100131 [Stenotrophomonas thermophila]|nr:hypothetical protein BN1263100131 [Stenotrophomonas maltophilia]